MGATVFVNTHDPIDRIAPAIYGHFAEHLGRCIYGGIWVGEDDRVETVDGLRRDTVDLLSALDMPVLRWPGGCFADDYDWEDGVGPQDDRPRRRNLHWAQGRAETFEESNAFGTDEFVRLCDELDTEPYLATNVGTGDPRSALDWAEYCNYGGDTTLADRRRANDQTGSGEDGYDVRYWGVGNENWGCGGRYSPEHYAEEYRRFANYLRTFDHRMSGVPMDLIAVGHITDDWNRRFLDALAGGVRSDDTPADLIDHLTVHRYYDAGDDTEFSEEQHYRLFARAREVGRDVDRASEALEVYAPRGDIGVVVDEWGVWHPQATAENGLEQENTVRDALSAALVLDDLNQRADVVTMANIAQTVNVLQCLVQTDETEAWKTPTYDVFELYERHMGATALRTVVDSDVEPVADEDFDVPLVTASASAAEDGAVELTLSNLDHATGREIRVETGRSDVTVADATVLFADKDPDAHSTAETADSFGPSAATVDAAQDGEVVVDAPPSSVVGLTLRD